jgi:hypothetical protein
VAVSTGVVVGVVTVAVVGVVSVGVSRVTVGRVAVIPVEIATPSAPPPHPAARPRTNATAHPAITVRVTARP